MKRIYVKNMKGNSGMEVPNQFIIHANEGNFFQSYHRTIAFIPYNGYHKTLIDDNYWNYSKSTGKYRNMFLGETKKETEKKIKSGKYKLTSLN